MERHRIVVVVIAGAALFCCAGGTAHAQAPGGGHRQGGGRFMGRARERWRQMSPEDRQRFRSNAERWLRLPPAEQRALRNREILRRARIRQEADQALKDSGLQLDEEKRQLYERRYLQERRKIERGLRQELQQKRERELAPVMEDLKKEFGTGAGNGSTPSTGTTRSTAGSPSPNK